MRMHTAVELNQAIKEHSSDAQIIIVNFPAPPSKLSAEENCFLLRHSLKVHNRTGCGAYGPARHHAAPQATQRMQQRTRRECVDVRRRIVVPRARRRTAP